jgi:hypothetical protein
MSATFSLCSGVFMYSLAMDFSFAGSVTSMGYSSGEMKHWIESVSVDDPDITPVSPKTSQERWSVPHQLHY